jgi:hypothetical protein
MDQPSEEQVQQWRTAVGDGRCGLLAGVGSPPEVWIFPGRTGTLEITLGFAEEPPSPAWIRHSGTSTTPVSPGIHTYAFTEQDVLVYCLATPDASLSLSWHYLDEGQRCRRRLVGLGPLPTPTNEPDHHVTECR